MKWGQGISDQEILAEGEGERKLRDLSAGAAEVDFEVSERLIFAHDGDVGKVEVGGVEKVELVLQVEVEKALHGAVRGNDAGGNSGVLGLHLHFQPVLVFGGSHAAGRKGDGQAAVRGGIFGFWTHRGVGDLVGGERFELLNVLIDADVEANAGEADFHGFTGIITESDVDGDDAGRERRALGKWLFVLRGVEPRLSGDGHAFVRLIGGGARRRRLLREGECCEATNSDESGEGAS